MNNRPHKNSAYADMVYRWVDRILNEGEGAFTLIQFSERSGLSVTLNLRRRLNHAVEAGLLDCDYALTENGGYALRFFRPEENERIDENG